MNNVLIATTDEEKRILKLRDKVLKAFLKTAGVKPKKPPVSHRWVCLTDGCKRNTRHIHKVKIPQIEV